MTREAVKSVSSGLCYTHSLERGGGGGVRGGRNVACQSQQSEI